MEDIENELHLSGYRTSADQEAITQADDSLIEEISCDYDNGVPITMCDIELIWEILDKRTALYCAKIGNYPTAQFLIS
jgi:hypothetical protein